VCKHVIYSKSVQMPITMIIKGQQLCVPVFSLRSLSSVEHEADAKHWSWRLLSSEHSFYFLRSCSGLPYSRKYRLTYCSFYPCSEWSLWGDECHTVPSALPLHLFLSPLQSQVPNCSPRTAPAKIHWASCCLLVDFQFPACDLCCN
jgi:hypothetical protein